MKLGHWAVMLLILGAACIAGCIDPSVIGDSAEVNPQRIAPIQGAQNLNCRSMLGDAEYCCTYEDAMPFSDWERKTGITVPTWRTIVYGDDLRATIEICVGRLMTPWGGLVTASCPILEQEEMAWSMPGSENTIFLRVEYDCDGDGVSDLKAEQGPLYYMNGDHPINTSSAGLAVHPKEYRGALSERPGLYRKRYKNHKHQ